jgi:hypothetical protein
MASTVVPGRFTARIDESFVVFIIGMWLPLHKDVGTRVADGATTVRLTA